MEQTLKRLCHTINGLYLELSSLGRDSSLPSEIQDACDWLSLELWDLDRQLYYTDFLKNDTKIEELTNAIEAAGEAANKVNEELDQVTTALKEVRKVVADATKAIEDIPEKYKNAMEKVDEVSDKVKEVLDFFGIAI